VLAPGAREIDYTFCRNGHPFQFSVEDDTFVQQVGAGGGVIELRAADGRTLVGPVTARWPG
jgi:hypothetical protein